MKKRNMLVMALTLAGTMVMSTFTAFAAAPSVDGRFLDDCDRATVNGANYENHDASKTMIYWTGNVGTLSFSDGVLHGQFPDGGNYRFATNNGDAWKYLILRIKGDDRAKNDKIYVRMGGKNADIEDGNSHGDTSLAALKGADGKPLPAITSEFQDLVIDVEGNGYSFGGGANAFQIGTWAAMNLDIDYIFMTNKDPNAPVPVVQHNVAVNFVKEDGLAAAQSLTKVVDDTKDASAEALEVSGYSCIGYRVDGAESVITGTKYTFTNVMADHSITFVYKANPVPTPTPVTHADPEAIVSTGALIDNFNRSKLLVSGGIDLSDKNNTKIYWNMFGPGSQSISDGVLHAKFNEGGYYRLATNNTDSWKYVVIRVKGDSRALNDKIYARMGNADKQAIDDGATEKSFAQLLGPNGKPIPKITSSWQNIVIDVSKSGFSFGGGSNGFQLGTWAAMNLDIDFVLMTNTIPNPSTGDNFPITAAVLALASAGTLIFLFRKKTQQQ